LGAFEKSAFAKQAPKESRLIDMWHVVLRKFELRSKRFLVLSVVFFTIYIFYPIFRGAYLSVLNSKGIYSLNESENSSSLLQLEFHQQLSEVDGIKVTKERGNVRGLNVQLNLSSELSCPVAFSDFLERQRFSCQLEESRNVGVLRIKPVQGFGNQLNGVLQGFFGAAIFQKCLHVDWKYKELISSHFQLERTSRPTRKIEKKLSFPNAEKFLSFSSLIKRKKGDLTIHVHYRDRVCDVVRDTKTGISMKLLSKEVDHLLRARGELCLFLESCMLRGLLGSRDHAHERQNMHTEENIIVMHIRAGDSVAFPNISVTQDERIPLTQLPLFWSTAEKMGKMHRNPKYYIATDSVLVLDSAKARFGEKLLHSQGIPSHDDLNSNHKNTDTKKLLIDWLNLANAATVIHGPWSTFTEKALVYNYFQQQERLVVKCASKESDECSPESVIEESTEWFCTKSFMRDGPKGPASFCF